MDWPVDVFIEGTPAKQGSKRLVPHVKLMEKHGVTVFLGGEKWLRVRDIPKYTLVLDADTKNKAWREKVAENFTLLSGLKQPIEEAVVLQATFYRPRPKSHYTKTGRLSAEGVRNPEPVTRPDSIKMMRSVEDALSGVAWKDDSYICHHSITKEWCDDGVPEGVALRIWPMSVFVGASNE